MLCSGCASLQRISVARLPEADYLAAGGAQLRAHACGRGDAAVGDVDRAVWSGGEAGGLEQLANAKAGALAVLADAHYVPGRVLGGQPVGLEFGGVERAVAAETAALHGGQAARPDRGAMGSDPPDARVFGGVEAAEQLPDIQRPVWAARDARCHRVTFEIGRHGEVV